MLAKATDVQTHKTIYVVLYGFFALFHSKINLLKFFYNAIGLNRFQNFQFIQVKYIILRFSFQ